MQTIMDDELRQVQEKIVETEEKLATAEDKGKEDLVLMYGNMLAKLYEKEARVEARLSAGEMHYNRGVCDITFFTHLLNSREERYQRLSMEGRCCYCR